MRSFALCRFSLVCGLLLYSGAAMDIADAASGTDVTVEQSEPNDILGVLEFRIAPCRSGSVLGPSPLTDQQIAGFRRDLAENGPAASLERDDKFVWVKIMPSVELHNPDQVIEEYQAMEYLLVHNWPPFVMSSKMGWGLQSINKNAKDDMGRSAIGFQIDRDGADRFYDLTSANIDRAVAIIIEGKVVSAPHIATAIRSHGMIAGSFTAEQIDDMARALGKIVRPVSSTPVPVRRRAMVTYLIPLLVFMLAISVVGFVVYR
jgi:hypothetical protein